jgi:xylulose-5-phosphate/fructose-6-phosphate phosphoketolase
VVLACCGDVPTLETLAAVDDPARAPARAEGPGRQRRRPDAPGARQRAPPRALRPEFDALFTTDKPVIFAYHGYPWLIHRLTYRRTNHDNIHVRGYKEEGTTTTPFDMVMLNDLDRFHLVMDVIDRVPSLGAHAANLRQEMDDERVKARAYTRSYGEDSPEIRDWTWPG